MNNKKTQTTQKVLDKIRSGEIHPKSRYYFVVKNWFFWLAFTLSIIFGSFAFSSIFYQVAQTPAWRLLSMEQEMLWFVMVSLPYVWIILLGLFTILAWLNFKNTRKSYEHRNYIIVIASIVIAFFGGLVLHSCGFSSQLHGYVGKHVPMYQSMDQMRTDRVRQSLGEYGLGMENLRSDKPEKLREQMRTGKKYLYDYRANDSAECDEMDIVCDRGERAFTNAMGCGCVKKLYKAEQEMSLPDNNGRPGQVIERN